jgi:hypothetical protein
MHGAENFRPGVSHCATLNCDTDGDRYEYHPATENSNGPLPIPISCSSNTGPLIVGEEALRKSGQNWVAWAPQARFSPDKMTQIEGNSGS